MPHSNVGCDWPVQVVQLNSQITVAYLHIVGIVYEKLGLGHIPFEEKCPLVGQRCQESIAVWGICLLGKSNFWVEGDHLAVLEPDHNHEVRLIIHALVEVNLGHLWEHIEQLCPHDDLVGQNCLQLFNQILPIGWVLYRFSLKEGGWVGKIYWSGVGLFQKLLSLGKFIFDDL